LVGGVGGRDGRGVKLFVNCFSYTNCHSTQAHDTVSRLLALTAGAMGIRYRNWNFVVEEANCYIYTSIKCVVAPVYTYACACAVYNCARLRMRACVCV
jgi:hypothetical protein